MKIKIDNIEYEVVYEFPVLYEAWECDYKGYVVKKNNKNKLVLSSHGRLYFAKNNELETKIKEYKNAIEKSKKGLQLVYNQEENEN